MRPTPRGGPRRPRSRAMSSAEMARLAEVVAATPDLVVMVSLDGTPMYANAAARATFGVGPDEELPPAFAVQYYAHRERARMLYEAVPHANEHGVWAGEVALLLPSGEEMLVSQVLVAHRGPHGEVDHYSSISRDVSERLQLEARLEHIRHHDALTGLPNRASFRRLLRRSLDDGPVAVLAIDLDHFKYVNDSYGHGQGDELIIRISERLESLLGEGDVLGRLGGDEFAVLRPHAVGADAGLALANQVLAALSRPFPVVEDDGELADVHLSASVGLAVSRPPTASADQLLRDADAAMYAAKERGRARVELFVEDMHHLTVQRLRTANDLHRALERNEFRVLYQPEVSLREGRIHAVEALVRWAHPTRGLVPPDEFIPLAEETGLIDAIGMWVLEQAAAQAARWADRRYDEGPIQVWVNLSPHQLAAPSLVAQVAEVLDRHGLAAGSLGLEITETALLRDADKAIATLDQLRELGVSLAVDDFGTGYSSLTYLKQLPVTQVKVDRSFVGSLALEGGGDVAIVRAVLAMAAALQLSTVAEGVETLAQEEVLRSLGCDLAQGFRYATPQPAHHIDALLATDRTAPVFPMHAASASTARARGPLRPA